MSADEAKKAYVCAADRFSLKPTISKHMNVASAANLRELNSSESVEVKKSMRRFPIRC